MKTRLLKNLTDEDKSLMKESLIKAQPFLKILKSHMEDDIEALHSSMRNEDMLKHPNWSLHQADRIAQVKAYKTIMSLFEI